MKIEKYLILPSKRGATRTLAIGLQNKLNFVDFTFSVDDVNIVVVDATNTDVRINSCKVKTHTSIEVENGCIEVDGGQCESSNAVPVVPL